MEPWTGAQSAFAVKGFYKNGDSFVIAQREFRREFGIHRNRAVPSAYAIKTWVRNFEATGSTLNKKGGNVKTASTPENIAVVREAIERSPHRSARRHSVSLGLSEASVRRILHKLLHFYPYKTSNSARSKRIPVEMLQRVMGDVRKTYRVPRADWWSSE
jgi:transposase